MHLNFRQLVTNLNNINQTLQYKIRIMLTTGKIVTPDEFLTLVNPDDTTCSFFGCLV